MTSLVGARLRLPLRPSAPDAVLALVLAVGAQVELWLSALPGSPGAQFSAAILTTVPLAWRTVAPARTVAVTAAGFALMGLTGTPVDEPVVPGLAPLVAVYSLGAHGTVRSVAAGSAIAMAIDSLLAAAGTEAEPSDLVINGGALVVALAVGRAVRIMGFENDMLEARATALEREGDEKAQAAVADERARVARELHDVIGHSISVMGVQAGAVRRLLTPEQQREREALLAVERIGRDAVAEMQRLLGFLRSNGDEHAAGAPPTLQRVGDLVGEMRGAGLNVQLHVDGEVDDLSPGRALAAFRILQEALTNALKHAPDAQVRVALRRTPAELEIEVANDGDARPAAPAGTGGHGLVGMRERVALYGGTLEAGPRDGTGFAVVARLPAGNA